MRAVVGITRSLGIRANAEGVETEAQAEMLRQEGCGEAQGYLFGRPMPAAGFLDVLAMPTPLPSGPPALPAAGSTPRVIAAGPGIDADGNGKVA